MSEDAIDLAGAVLGETTGRIAVADRDTLGRVALRLVSQCRRTLDIVSRHLDPPIYDTDEFATAVKSMVLGSRHSRVRLLVVDPRPLVAEGHRLLDLAARLSSFIAVRVPASHHKSFNEAFLLADNSGYVHRQFSDRFEAEASFHDRRATAALSDRFETMWEHGTPDMNLRRLHI